MPNSVYNGHHLTAAVNRGISPINPSHLRFPSTNNNMDSKANPTTTRIQRSAVPTLRSTVRSLPVLVNQSYPDHIPVLVYFKHCVTIIWGKDIEYFVNTDTFMDRLLPWTAATVPDTPAAVPSNGVWGRTCCESGAQTAPVCRGTDTTAPPFFAGPGPPR